MNRDKSPAHARVVLAATAVMSLAVAVPVPPVRALLVLPVALLAPGYALLLALFGDARRTGLDPVPLLALSALLSLACYPLLALLLHLAALPIATGTMVGATDTTIMLLLVSASWHSSQRSPAMAAPHVGAQPDVATGGAWEGPRGVIHFALVIAAAGLILAATLRLLPAPAGAPYTMLYLAGRSAYLAGPIAARGYRAPGPGERCAVRTLATHRAARAAATGAVSTVTIMLGVTNGTGRHRSYHVVPLLDDVPCWRGQMLSLGPGASWSGHVGGPVPADGALHRLTITLRQPVQLGGGGLDQAGSVGPLVVWVQGARLRRAMHDGSRQPSRQRRHDPRLIRHHVERSPTARATVVLRQRRASHARSPSDHVSTIVHRPRSPRRSLPGR